jgi:5-methylcytosine-specific restriction endonuclease McrA
MPLKFEKPISRAKQRQDAKRLAAAEQKLIRKLIHERDNHRCRVCNRRDGVDVHHLRYRSRGGKDVPSNLLCLCRICHADVHAWRLAIIGDNANGKLKFVRRDVTA